MDYFDALLTGGTNDPERMKETARQLRRQQAYGTLGALTGDPVLSQFGTGMVERAGERASVLQKARQAGTTARALGGCSYEQGGVIKEIPGCQEARREGFQNKLLLQALKSQGKETEDYQRMPKWAMDQASAQASALDEIGRIQSDFKDEYTQTMGPGPQSRIPNIAARYGVTVPGVPQTKEAQKWWAKYRRLVTLPERNKLFGATLSDKEKASWDEVDLNPSMDPQQIKDGITTLLDLANRAATRSRTAFSEERYRPGTLEAIYGEEGPEGATVAAGSTSWGSPEDVRDAFRNGELTETEAADILRNEFGME